jgi:hypothetical protein
MNTKIKTAWNQLIDRYTFHELNQVIQYPSFLKECKAHGITAITEDIHFLFQLD